LFTFFIIVGGERDPGGTRKGKKEKKFGDHENLKPGTRQHRQAYGKASKSFASAGCLSRKECPLSSYQSSWGKGRGLAPGMSERKVTRGEKIKTVKKEKAGSSYLPKKNSVLLRSSLVSGTGGGIRGSM